MQNIVGGVLSFAFSAIFCSIIFLNSKRWKIGLDNDTSGPQKFHKEPVPRIGGISVYIAILLTILIFKNKTGMYLIVASVPAFLGGLLEDLTGGVGAKNRLFLTMVSAGIGILLLDARVKRIDIPIFDKFLYDGILLSVIFTLFAVGGLSHGINMIDGFNGISGGVTILIGLSIAIVGVFVHDENITFLSLLLVFAIVGFLIFNFPKGKVFLGDGGAYFIGFFIGEILVILVNNHTEVSAWFPMVVLSYPVTEVFFSIYRKKILMKRSPMSPDKLHLHMIVYKRIIKKYEKVLGSKGNALTAPYFWILSLISIIPGTFFWNKTILLIASFSIFISVYLVTYWSLAKFKTPKLFFLIKKFLILII